MKIYIGWEDSHGDLCYADSPKKVIKYFIDHHWIDENTELYDDNDNITTVKKAFGEKWENILLNMDDFEFSDTFVDCFGIKDEELL